jgi:hypothetical protein
VRGEILNTFAQQAVFGHRKSMCCRQRQFENVGVIGFHAACFLAGLLKIATCDTSGLRSSDRAARIDNRCGSLTVLKRVASSRREATLLFSSFIPRAIWRIGGIRGLQSPSATVGATSE